MCVVSNCNCIQGDGVRVERGRLAHTNNPPNATLGHKEEWKKEGRGLWLLTRDLEETTWILAGKL